MFVGGVFTMFDIATSALRAERARMNVHANNMANMLTTHDENGNPKPYTRKRVYFRPGAPEVTGSEVLGVSVARIDEDHSTAYLRRYEPQHPDADENGEVLYPNVSHMEETVNMMVAQRAYEANLTSFDSAKQIFNNALQMIA